MKYALDFMFYYDHRLTREHWPKDDPVRSAQSAVILMVGMYLGALVFGMWRLTGFDAIGWFSQFWPETHRTGKGMRALDGLPILLMVATVIWTHWYYSHKRAVRIILRFSKMTDEEYRKFGKLSVFLRFSGVICVFLTALKYDLINALLLFGVAWANWVIYRRFYRTGA